MKIIITECEAICSFNLAIEFQKARWFQYFSRPNERFIHLYHSTMIVKNSYNVPEILLHNADSNE